ncbi:MAG: hypothetical protein PHU08_03795, partial [Dehalococcoidales bacterium]|nr:hypothetical protein [Dehalococcoidales bacterium]
MRLWHLTLLLWGIFLVSLGFCLATGFEIPSLPAEEMEIIAGIGIAAYILTGTVFYIKWRWNVSTLVIAILLWPLAAILVLCGRLYSPLIHVQGYIPQSRHTVGSLLRNKKLSIRMRIRLAAAFLGQEALRRMMRLPLCRRL